MKKNDEQQKKHKAVALHYDREIQGEAPRIKAKGTGFVAEQIIELAKDNNIPIQEDPALVEILSRLDLDQQIPAELYEVVAEILAMVYQLEKRSKSHE
jgi:flagellar biosynthesis protein